ncbi:aminopeptidase N-like isoform X2 [Thrips palmi]|uniref:Aminopeptidase N-like isoform X2 n=1 Tax=Thrips palmi TaxID=161013 RepID=A0A6P8Z3A5_THRPL|nr:aminopeptidase N-like isoform X2 [Thrips palmi]
MVQWCGLLVLVATAALVRGSALGPGPAPRLVLPPAGRIQDDAEKLLGLPAGVQVDPAPPRRYSPAPKAAVKAVRADADPYRLPQNVVPTRYQLALTVDMTVLSFTGSVSISLNVLADTDTIVLHAADNLGLPEDSVRVEAADHSTVAVSKVERNSQYSTVTVTLAAPLQKNAHYTLSFSSFSSDLLGDLSGFYKSSYVTSDGTTRYLATTQFESINARKAFPCFDEPSLKARFDIQITHDKGYGVRSNMPLLSTSSDDRTQTTVFKSTVPMSTYLLAWVVSDFEKVSNADETFNTWARKDIVAGATISQQVGQEALKQLAEYTGIAYVMPKTDQFAIPDFSAGAMENWGLVTYREPYLIKTENTDVSYEQTISTIICHELSHQWTGNLVTMDWWSNTWLNEGFATFFENFICDKINPDMKLIEKAITTYAQVAFNNDLIDTQHAMSSPVSSPAEIEAKFDRISYSKGGTVLRMFQHILTPAVFQKGLSRYLATNMFMNGTPEKLFRALAAEAAAANDKTPDTVSLPDNVDFPAVARSWTEQPGAPVVTASCDFRAKKCTLSQQQLRSASSTSKTSNKWYIPVTVITSKSADLSAVKTVAWLTPDKDSVSIDIDVDDDSAQWVIINPQQTGYYRVQYDDASRGRILAALLDSQNEAVLDGATRAQYLSDVLGLAQTDKLDWTETVKALQTLKDTQNSAVWLAGFRVISTLANELANTDVYSSFKIILDKVTASTFEKVGLKVKETDDHNTRHLRYFVAPYACASGNADCLAEAATMLKDLFANSVLPHVDMARAVLCYGLKTTDDTVFANVKQLWQSATGTTRSDMATALACAPSQKLVSTTGLIPELLSKTKAKEQDKSDLYDLFDSIITQQPDHRRALLDFVKGNWQKIDTFFGDTESLAMVLTSIIGTIRNDAELSEVQQWVRSTFSGRAEYANIQGSLSIIEDRLHNGWYRSNYEKVAAYIYLETNTHPPAGPTTSHPPTSNPGPTSARPTGQPGPGPNPSTAKPNGASFVAASTTTLLSLVLLVAALAQRA